MQLSAFPFSTILFDLDGTLVDSAPDVLEAIAAVLRDAGEPVPRMELSIIGPRWKAFSAKSARMPTTRK